MYQYRVTINGSIGKVTDNSPVNWNEIAQYIDERGGIATLERRYITDDITFLDLLTDKTQYIKLGNKVVQKWEVFAQIEA